MNEIREILEKSPCIQCDRSGGYLMDDGHGGCVMCPRASKKSRKFEAQYYPNFVKLYKIYFVKMYKKLIGQGKPLSRFWNNGEDFFVWWLNGNAKATELELFN